MSTLTKLALVRKVRIRSLGLRTVYSRPDVEALGAEAGRRAG